jgi:uncharacterized protein (TIGR03437 family)
LCLLSIGLCATNRAAAQCESAPSAFATTCSQMQSGLSSYNTTLTGQWHGSKSSTLFGTELLSSNDNLGLKGILASNAMEKVNTELDALSKLGVTFVVTAVSFPILYQPFYTYNNDPQDYASVLAFYENVMAAARQHGMKVLIESTVVFPSYATDLPLKQYYATLTTDQLAAGRAQVAQIVAQQLQPDWLNMGSEPDTISSLVGLSSELTAAEWASDISTIVAQLRSAGIKGSPLIGAGCGAWQIGGSDYVSALMSTGIDYFDTHVFTVGEIALAEALLDQAIAAGKSVAISETWDHKVADSQLQGLSEYGIINAISSVEAYNAYSFTATQDGEFLGEMIDLGYWKKLLYVAPFESELFFANVNYNQTASLSTASLSAAETAAESAAWANGSITPLGQWFTAAIQPVNATTISAAWDSGAVSVAPASSVSIYGTALASSAESATQLPLPTTLGGSTATLTDANGVESSLPLFFAGPNQINAEIPASAGEGPGVITIKAPAGTVTSPVVVTPVAPGLFTANESGQGVAAAEFVTNENGKQTIVDIFSGACSTGTCDVPLDVSSGQTALVLFGTGIENRSSLSVVTVTIGKQTLPVDYAGPTPGLAGLDQVNVLLPASLAGSGTVNITVSVDGTVSNTVTANFK